MVVYISVFLLLEVEAGTLRRWVSKKSIFEKFVSYAKSVVDFGVREYGHLCYDHSYCGSYRSEF